MIIVRYVQPNTLNVQQVERTLYPYFLGMRQATANKIVSAVYDMNGFTDGDGQGRNENVILVDWG